MMSEGTIVVRHRLVLYGVLLVGFFLRFHELGQQSLWLDEAYTWDMIVDHDWVSVWKAMLFWSNVSPLPYVLTKLILPVFGINEFTLRLLSAFWGWLAIPVVYRLGQAIFSRQIGLAAMAFVAFSPFAVWYSRDARAYGLYMFLSTLSLWGFLRAERGKGWGLYIAASAALYVTHYVAVLYVYALAAYTLTHLRYQPLLFRRWALAQLLAVLPVVAWVIVFLSQRRLMAAMGWIPAVDVFTPLRTLWNFATGDAVQCSPLMVVGVLTLLGVLVWGARSWSSPVRLMFWWLVLPLATAWLWSLRKPSYVDRYFEPGILPVALLVAAGVSTLPHRWRQGAMALAVTGLLFGSARLYVDPMFAKENWRDAARLISSEQLPVGIVDPESLAGLAPYAVEQTRFVVARDEHELSGLLAGGEFALVLRSPHESIHALSKSAPFDPLTEGPEFFRQWLAENPSVSVDVHPFTGLALVVINK